MNEKQLVPELEVRLLRIAEAAAIAGICKSRAYEYANDGTWPAVRLGKSIRIPRKGLEKWLSNLEAQAGVEA